MEIVSSSTNDTVAGAGARTVKISNLLDKADFKLRADAGASTNSIMSVDMSGYLKSL